MFAGLFQGALVKLTSFAIAWLSANLIEMIFDAIDEAAESALESLEEKALATPRKSDDRRIAVLRKYFEGWKVIKKKK